MTSTATPTETEPKSKESRDVPAVAHTIAIFEYFRERGNEAATMTEIAQTLSINPSTCFNILKTLTRADLLAWDPTSKRYHLGTGLSDLGAAVGEEGAVLSTARMRALEFVRRYKLILLLCQKADDDSFIVIDKLRGRPEPKATAPLGSHIPPNGAVLAKAYYAWRDDAVVDHMLELHGLPARTPSSITHIEDFKRELSEVRERGYSTSLGEYEPDYNAVGTPILGPKGTPVLLMVVTGHSSFMPLRLIPAIGKKLRETADEISVSVFHLEGAAKAPIEQIRRASGTGTKQRHPEEGRARAA